MIGERAGRLRELPIISLARKPALKASLSSIPALGRRALTARSPYTMPTH